MGKTGWQVATFLSVALAALCAAAAWHSKQSLAVANAEIRRMQNVEPQITPEAMPVPMGSGNVAANAFRAQVMADNHIIMQKRPKTSRCIGGELLLLVEGEWRNNGPC
ncbi:hypothetical protein J2X06_002946 [Lysobacter niastensis]|uniref:Uncharacterized protein n=1 Tax=Lysobacter niastensis TaxID=380629 RepID=A0ABU1WDP0_9GAMM|nr:hypothetical protein [Lysobacter niastensis]MDR7135728.1 hypothetical protein [Lysobacter niastensis]